MLYSQTERYCGRHRYLRDDRPVNSRVTNLNYLSLAERLRLQNYNTWGLTLYICLFISQLSLPPPPLSLYQPIRGRQGNGLGQSQASEGTFFHIFLPGKELSIGCSCQLTVNFLFCGGGGDFQ